MLLKYSIILLAPLLFALCECNDGAKEKGNKSFIKVPYYVRVGEGSRRYLYSQNVTILGGSNFYSVMQIAASVQPIKYGFKATVHPIYGHFITTIGGVSENKHTNFYWMIYVTDYAPDFNHPDPTDKHLSKYGVDSLIVQEGLYYTFWWKHVDDH